MALGLGGEIRKRAWRCGHQGHNRYACSIAEDLLLPVDAEVMLDALNNPDDEADLSANLLWNYADMIDVSGRKEELADDPLYAPYCGT